ncbi:acyl-CoA dehydrogenase family protein [Pseudonocardia ailaonensis]|uniref:Acyl-CoA dehydrogenase family protein n=1 Tax=Pseudonocardia ailaonensis TaxID=367279 RepID=A0ABN2N662_9PSEU
MTDTLERAALRDVTRSVLADLATEQQVREHMDGDGFDRALWAAMAQVGLLGLAVPEELGGSGAGWTEQSVVHEELGRTLACVPFLATATLAAAALSASTDEARSRWLPGLAAGTTIVTVAAPAAGSGSWYDPPSGVSAESSGPAWRLAGRLRYVLDAAVADLFLVTADAGGTVGLFAVERADVASVEPVATSDRTRRVGHVVLHDSPAVMVGGPEAVLAAHGVGVTMLAAEQTGGAAACLERSVDHVRTRVQFGRPIGSFQAVQHHCANMLLRVESARSAARRAAQELDDPPGPDADPGVVSRLIAGSVCTEAYLACASTNVQLHGGTGFTWEHSAQLHVKRSRGSAVLLGQPAEHRRALRASGKVLVGL